MEPEDVDEYEFDLFANIRNLSETYNSLFDVQIVEEEENKEEILQVYREHESKTNEKKEKEKEKKEDRYNIDLTEISFPYINELMTLEPLNKALNITEILQVNKEHESKTKEKKEQKEDRYNIDLTEISFPYITELMTLEPLNNALNVTYFNSTDTPGKINPSEAQANAKKDEDVIREAFIAIDDLILTIEQK